MAVIQITTTFTVIYLSRWHKNVLMIGIFQCFGDSLWFYCPQVRFLALEPIRGLRSTFGISTSTPADEQASRISLQGWKRPRVADFPYQFKGPPCDWSYRGCWHNQAEPTHPIESNPGPRRARSTDVREDTTERLGYTDLPMYYLYLAPLVRHALRFQPLPKKDVAA